MAILIKQRWQQRCYSRFWVHPISTTVKRLVWEMSGKHNYSKIQLATPEGAFSPEDWNHLRVEVFGKKIRVFVDNMGNPVLEYEDQFPFMGG